MFAIEAVFGLLVMIELPQSPGACVVAVLAKCPQLLLMRVLPLVATQTITRRVLVSCTLMARLAGGGQMPPRERESRQSMVEFFNTP